MQAKHIERKLSYYTTDTVGLFDKAAYRVFVTFCNCLTEGVHLLYICVHHMKDVVCILGEDRYPHVRITLRKTHGR